MCLCLTVPERGKEALQKKCCRGGQENIIDVAGGSVAPKLVDMGGLQAKGGRSGSLWLVAKLA